MDKETTETGAEEDEECSLRRCNQGFIFPKSVEEEVSGSDRNFLFEILCVVHMKDVKESAMCVCVAAIKSLELL